MSSRRCGPIRHPLALEWSGDITEREHALATYNPDRTHDVTLFILDPDDRIGLIRKPHFAAGIWRPPGGGIKPAEDFVHGRRARGARGDRRGRAARALSGRHPRDRFLCAAHALSWQTHVFLARTMDTVLAPRDTDEIAGARWGTLPELGGPLRERLLATGHALWRYRVALHDAALRALDE